MQRNAEHWRKNTIQATATEVVR